LGLREELDMRRLLLIPYLGLSCGLGLACSAGGNSTSSGATGDTGSSAQSGAGGAGGAGGGSISSSSSGQGGGLNLGGFGQGGGGGGMPLEAEVFAHSPNTLFKLDPISKGVTTVGPFNGCSSVIDIALDKDGQMFGTTFSGLYRINKTSASCSLVSQGAYPNSLSFVPKGTVDPNVEALVGYQGGTYVRIDTTSGAVTNIGSLGNGYSSSGDIVSVIGGGTYLTVNGNGCGDCIVEVNPTTGAFVKLIGPLGQAAVYGLAFWGGVAYGFNDGGKLFSIDLSNGSTTLIPMPNPPAGLQFWGAGSTTAAPLTIPK